MLIIETTVAFDQLPDPLRQAAQDADNPNRPAVYHSRTFDHYPGVQCRACWSYRDSHDWLLFTMSITGDHETACSNKPGPWA